MNDDNIETIIDFSQTSTQKVLNNLRLIIREKTRFESDDVLLKYDETFKQKYSIEVKHEIEPVVNTEHITGAFTVKESSESTKSDNPVLEAEREQSKRLEQAASLINVTIKKSGTKYNSVQSGVLLLHDRKYWSLSKCIICKAQGRVDCNTCNGRREESCWNCSGSKYINCDGYGCLGGHVACIKCSGSGQVSETENYQESFWNGSSTEYRTAYRTVYVRCSGYGCMGGKVQCTKCQGIAQISCYTCSRTGKITCRTCNGSGDITCGVCEGTTESGIASWVDIIVKPSYLLELQDECVEAREAANKEGVDGLPLISEAFDYQSTCTNGIPPNLISSIYDGQFELINLKVSCGNNLFKVTAYGSDLRWLSLDGIIEHIVNSDLSLLEKALIECADSDLTDTRIDDLIEGIKNVIASEVSSDALEVKLNDKVKTAHSDIVSQEFCARVNRCILGSLRHLYLRLAKVFWWKLMLTVITVNMLSSMTFGPGWTFCLSVLTVILGWLIFEQKVKNLLRTSISNDKRVNWLTDVAKKSGRSNYGNCLALAPSVILLLILTIIKMV